jgi:hypothetical protein
VLEPLKKKIDKEFQAIFKNLSEMTQILQKLETEDPTLFDISYIDQLYEKINDIISSLVEIQALLDA